MQAEHAGIRIASSAGATPWSRRCRPAPVRARSLRERAHCGSPTPMRMPTYRSRSAPDSGVCAVSRVAWRFECAQMRSFCPRRACSAAFRHCQGPPLHGRIGMRAPQIFRHSAERLTLPTHTTASKRAVDVITSTVAFHAHAVRRTRPRHHHRAGHVRQLADESGSASVRESLARRPFRVGSWCANPPGVLTFVIRGAFDAGLLACLRRAASSWHTQTSPAATQAG